MSDLALSIKVSANAKEALDSFVALKKRVTESGQSFDEATEKTGAAKRAWDAAKQAADALAVQAALGKRELDALAASVGKNAPEFHAHKQAVAETATAWKSAQAAVKSAESDFNRAHKSAATLKDRLQEQRQALEMARRSVASHGLAVNDLAGSYQKLNREAASADKLKAIGNQFQQLAKNADQATGSVDRTAGIVSGRLSALTGLAGTALIGLSLKDTLVDLVKTAAETQNLETRLRTLTASAQAYAQEDAYLINLAKQHHKSLKELSDSYASVLALEKSGLMTRQQGMAVTEGLSNATSALGASSTQLHQVMFGLAQALSSGTVRAEEFNQVTEPLPGLMQAMDKAAGLAAGGLRKMVNDGKVTSAFFLDVLIKALHEFDGAAARTGSNLTAKFTDIENAYTNLAKALNKPLTNTLTPFVDAITGSLERLTAVVKRLTGEKLVIGDVPADLLQRTRTRGQPLGFAPTGQTLIPPDAREKLRDAKPGGPLEILASQAGAEKTKEQDTAYRRELLQADIQIARNKKNLVEAIRLEVEAMEGLSQAEREALIQRKLVAEQGKSHTGGTAGTKNDQAQQIEADLALQKDALQLQEAQLKDSLERQAIDYRQYYEQLYQLRAAYLQAEIDGKSREAGAGKDAGDKARLQVEVAKLQAQLADLPRQQASDVDAAAQKEVQALQSIVDQYDAYGAAVRKARDDQVKLWEAVNTGVPGAMEAWNQFAQHVGQRLEEVKQKADGSAGEMDHFWQGAVRNMESSIGDFLFDPFKDGLDGMATGFANTLRRMAADAAAAKIGGYLFGTDTKGGAPSGGVLGQAWDGISNWLGFGGGNSGPKPPGPDGAAGAVANLASTAVGAGAVPSSAAGSLTGQITGALSGCCCAGGGVADAGAGLLERGAGITEVAEKAADTIKSGMEEAGGGLVDDLGGTFSGFTDDLGSLFDGLGESLSGLLDGLFSGGGGSGGGSAGGLLGGLFSAGGSAAGSAAGGSGMLDGIGSWFSEIFSSIGFFHEGGIVGGAPTFSRDVPMSVFFDAPRYHRGGLAGLAPDEVPAILQRGEEVLPANDPRHRANGGGAPGGMQLSLRMNNIVSPTLFSDFLVDPSSDRDFVNKIERNGASIRHILHIP
jgi:tape measure domain-containing protein